MLAAYPALTDAQLAWHPVAERLAMSEFPPSCGHLDAEGELAFTDYWWVYCHLLCLDACTDAHGDVKNSILYHMGLEAPSREATELGLLALQRPTLFFMLVRAKFQVVLSCWREHGVPDPVYVREFEEHLRVLDELETQAVPRDRAAR